MILQPTPPGASSPESDIGKIKVKRQSKPKVKTGCYVCKQRRIKCDETRPSCINCVKTKRECCGYPAPLRRAAVSEQHPLLPRPPAARDLMAAAPPPRIAAQTPVPATPSQTQLAPRRGHKQQVRGMQIRVMQGLVTPIASARTSPVAQIPLPHSLQAHPYSGLPIQMQLQRACQLVYQPAMMQLNDVNGMYFQLFRTSTASELSGYFDAGFWTKSVLQGAEFEPSIRYAVVALGALYKTLEKSSESPPASPHITINMNDTPSHHWQIAVKHYSDACKEMSRMKGIERQSMRTQLMANVLLACFDSFIGDHEQAISQIKNGLHLVHQLRSSHRNQFIRSGQEPVDDDLVHMFTRLAIQAKTYDMAFHFPEPHVVRLIPKKPNPDAPPSPLSEPEPSSPAASGLSMPLHFATLVEARVAWDKLVHKIFRFTEAMFQSGDNPMGLLAPQDILRYGESFHTQLKEWDVRFEPLFQARGENGVTPQVKAGIATLRMTYIMSYILFVMTSQHNELAFDFYEPRFQEIVDLALEVVGDQEIRAAARKGCHPEQCQHKYFNKVDIFGKYPSELLTYHIKPSFSADMGIVQPLYVVATKCRNGTIRRQAIQLLRNSARREAMWDSELCARIGQWIVDIEEDGEDFPSPIMQQQFSPGQLPFPTQNDLGQRISVASSSVSPRSEFGDSLGPGGNGSWNWNLPRRESLLAQVPISIKEEKRVMVSAVMMNLRERRATIRCGTRGIKTGQFDTRAQTTTIHW